MTTNHKTTTDTLTLAVPVDVHTTPAIDHIWFADEPGKAERPVQNALMRLMLERKMGA